jgi:hypothetical protein
MTDLRERGNFRSCGPFKVDLYLIMSCQHRLTNWSKSGAPRPGARNGVNVCSRLLSQLAPVQNRWAQLCAGQIDLRQRRHDPNRRATRGHGGRQDRRHAWPKLLAVSPAAPPCLARTGRSPPAGSAPTGLNADGHREILRGEPDGRDPEGPQREVVVHVERPSRCGRRRVMIVIVFPLRRPAVTAASHPSDEAKPT